MLFVHKDNHVQVKENFGHGFGNGKVCWVAH